MFGLSIIKTAELKTLQNDVAMLVSDVNALNRKYNNLTDQVQRNDTATRKALDTLDNAVLAKSKTCPALQQTPKHVTDPVGAWESKQRVLEARLKSTTADVGLYERNKRLWSGISNGTACIYARLKRQAQEQVEQIKQDIHEHGTRKPVVVQKAPEGETAVVVRHKKYNTLGLLKGHHITILSKGNQLDVGDVILNATPAVVHKFWDILPHADQVTFNV